MDDATLLSTWATGLTVACVLVVAAAALLIGIWLAARRILRTAVRTLGVVEKIKANTQSIWALEQTGDTARDLAEAAEAIRGHGATIAKVLTEAEDSDRVA